jgi:hypothetical protein
MKCVALLSLVVVAGMCSSASADIGNGGFETGITYDVAPAPGNWLAFFGPAGTQNVSVTNLASHSGAQHLITSLSGAPNSFNGVVQPMDGIVTGNSYTLSFWARAGGPVLNGAEYRIEWLNAAGGFVGGQFDLNTPIQSILTSEYQQFSLTATAPAEAVRANVVFAVQTFLDNGRGFDTTVYWDDVSLVPAPGAAALLGLGGLTLMGRRRR